MSVLRKDRLKNSFFALIGRSVGRGLVVMIRVYQATLSPLIGGQCRFVPSCSNYAIEAIRHFGPAKGGLLSLKRVFRCHPFGGKGCDPPVAD